MSSDLSSPQVGKTTRIQQMFVTEIPNLRGFLWTLVPNHHRLDDIVQETFLTVSQKAETFEEGSNFRAWLFTIGRYKALQSLRESRQEGLLSPEVLEMITDHSEPPPDDTLLERSFHLRDCMEKLPRNGKEMLILRYAHRKSLTQIAEALSLRTDSVKVMLSRYRALLRTCIERKTTKHQIIHENLPHRTH